MSLAPMHSTFCRPSPRTTSRRSCTGQAQYSCLPNEHGGIVDDLIVYYLEPNHYNIVVNASTMEKDWAWFTKWAKNFDVKLTNFSHETALLAIQGKGARDVLQKLTDVDLGKIEYYHFTGGDLAGVHMMISRTGYTGEPGFEIMFPQEGHASRVWDAIFDAAKPMGGLEPIGLGARDTLRLEMGYCLYGNDINDETNPLEAGLGWITKLKKSPECHAFPIIREAKERGLTRKLTGLITDEKSAIMRHGHKIVDENGYEIGEITSGNLSPMLNKSIALGICPDRARERRQRSARGSAPRQARESSRDEAAVHQAGSKVTDGLSLENVTMRFGGLTAVGDLAFDVGPRDLVGLIGPNGAGKTTVFNMITGVYQPTSGSVRFFGETLNGLKPNEITHRGIARTFQNIRLFRGLSVFDNIRVSFTPHAEFGLWRSMLRIGPFDANEDKIGVKIEELLDLFNLREARYELATSLPYGDQRRLEIVRALATNPKLLLLDEPAAGMNPSEKQSLMKLIRQLRDEFKIAILLIEHDMSLVMGICEQIHVLDYGLKIAEGNPHEIRSNQRVIEAYLGEEAPTAVGD